MPIMPQNRPVPPGKPYPPHPTPRVERDFRAEQDRRREANIAYMNSLNAAISLFGAMQGTQEWADEDIKRFVTRWRDFFIDEWQRYEAKPDSSKHTPF